MQHAHQFMDKSPLTVTAELSVIDLSRLLLDNNADGACVIDEKKRLIGVVTTMDLVFREKRVHMPSFFAFMDAVLPLGLERTEQELLKISGTTVGAIMSRNVQKVDPDARLDVIAARMVEDHLTIVPVVDNGQLVGVITKKVLLQAATHKG